MAYGDLPLIFSGVSIPEGVCEFNSSTGSLPILLDVPGIGEVLTGTSTATANIQMWSGARTLAFPRCDWRERNNHCFVNQPATADDMVMRWSIFGFTFTKICSGLGNVLNYVVFQKGCNRPVATTPPYEFYVNLNEAGALSGVCFYGPPCESPLGTVIQNAENYLHETLVNRLPALPSAGNWFTKRIMWIQEPPADVLLTDAKGRTTGKRAGSEAVADIPLSGYVSRGDWSGILVLDPPEGPYSLEVTGLPGTSYSLDVSTVDLASQASEPRTTSASQGGLLPRSGSVALCSGAMGRLSDGLQLTTDQLANAAVGKRYSTTLSACGGSAPYRWKKLAKLPKGLKLAAKTGVISGTPKATGTYTVNVKVTDAKKPRPKRRSRPRPSLLTSPKRRRITTVERLPRRSYCR